MKHHHAAIGVEYLLYLHPEAEPFKHLLCHSYRIDEGFSANHFPRHGIRHSQEKVSTTLVSERHAIFEKPPVVELLLCFLEFKPLVLRRCLAPQINLCGCSRHEGRCQE